jgi:AcrR family transcriptional regulator
VKRGEGTIQRVLDAAQSLYASGGHAAFTIAALSAESGVSVGSLYHHFGSADGIAAALYSRNMIALLDRLVASLEGATSARAGIARVTRAYLDHVLAHPAEMRFIYASSYAAFLPAHAAAIASAKAPRLMVMIDFIRKHVASGQIVELPEPLYEMLIIGPVAEVSQRWLAGAPGYDLEAAKKHLPERIWHAIRASP